MTPSEVQQLFTAEDGTYRFARWGRPIVPVVFGLDDASLGLVKGAIEAVVTLAGHRMAETDPEMGANLMIFFFRDWSELQAIPDLEGLVPGLPGRSIELGASGATQYRHFRFEPGGAIRAAFVFRRIGTALEGAAAEALALNEAVQVILCWVSGAFDRRAALASADGVVGVHPEIAALIRAAYDPVLPVASGHASHALRLAARLVRERP